MLEQLDFDPNENTSQPNGDDGLVDLKRPFLRLPKPKIRRNISGSNLDTVLYEHEIASRNGNLNLDNLHVDCLSDEEFAHYSEIVPFRCMNNSSEVLDEVCEAALRFPDPLAKIVKDVKELERDVLMIYQLAYAHYVLAKDGGFVEPGRVFPNKCCGPSSRDLMVCSMFYGFLNATCAIYEGGETHLYLMFPFVMQEPNVKGVILQDPTSDQLWSGDSAPRNYTAIKMGVRWKYVTEWDGGKNLFPSRVMYLRDLLDP